MKISLVQMDCVKGDVGLNLRKAQRLIESANGADLLLFPEMWTSGFDWQHIDSLAERADSIERQLGEMAHKHQLWIASTTLSRDKKNQLSLFSPEKVVAHYAKMHLFPLMDEPLHLSAGSRSVCAQTPWGTVGFAICYDLRFPELFRALCRAGAQLILVSAAFPAERIAHWDLLLKARALENQVFIAACNQTGNGFGGHSTLIDPFGDTLIQGGGEEGVFSFSIDLQQTAQARSSIDYLKSVREGQCYSI